MEGDTKVNTDITLSCDNMSQESVISVLTFDMTNDIHTVVQVPQIIILVTTIDCNYIGMLSQECNYQ